MASRGLINLSISNFRGIVEFDAAPNGKSVTLKGRNGAGKSSAIDALFWALGGQLEGEVVRNGAEAAEVEVRFDDYLVRRRQTKGKKPTLDVRSADGKAKFSSPTALLSGFVGAIERRTFSAKPAKERTAVLRQLAPGLDCSDLDGQRLAAYDERTDINREAKALRAQAEGVVVPAAPAVIGEERPIVDVVDVAAIAAKKGDVEKVRAENARIRAEAAGLAKVVERCAAQRDEVAAQVEAARRALADAEEKHRQWVQQHRASSADAEAAASRVAALVDPDTSAIDAEIAAAREQNAAARRATEEHNRAVRAAQQQAAEVKRAAAERARLEHQASAHEAAAKKLTERLEAIDKEKAARLAAANLPIAGIGLAGDTVTFDDGDTGPVEIEALNTATRIRLDVAIAAALGNRVIAVRDASLLDAEQRAALERFATERGVQLLAEVVASGEPLTAEIVEADSAVIDAVVSQQDFQL